MSNFADRMTAGLPLLYGELGELAAYAPVSAPVPAIGVTVIPHNPDEDFAGLGGGSPVIREAQSVFKVQVSEIAEPEKGSGLTVTFASGDVVYTIIDFRTEDDDRLEWILDCDKV